MHERFFNHHNGSALSSILRNTVNRIGSSYVVHGGGGAGGGGGGAGGGGRSRDTWRHAFGGPGAAGASHAASSILASANALKFKGRQLLDQEGLSCLLIILFIDDPKINTTRLHRILRNLCYHAPTREWVVKCLLSILEKSNDKQPPQLDSVASSQQHLLEMPPAKIRKSTSKSGTFSSDMAAASTSSKNSGGEQQRSIPSWLNISMDAALGFRANVFQVTRSTAGGKKSSNGGQAAGAASAAAASTISIHPGASAVVCRHTLEVLISLAKSFSAHFLPWKDQDGSAPVKKARDMIPQHPPGVASKNASVDFWDTLLKLDQLSSSNKKGKSVARSHSSVGSLKASAEADGDEDASLVNFENSPFGILLGMLSSPVIRRNSVLTDKLLRLLSLISLGQPDILKKKLTTSVVASTADDAGGAEAGSSKSNVIRSEHLKLAVEVLTSKSCSEEGLEDVTALLLNLSYGPEPTRDTILGLLLQGAQELGNVVRQNIVDLQTELRSLKTALNPDGEEAGSSSDKQSKGAVIDRFTKEAVVVSAPSKVKGGAELQLPAMNALTNKTSSQAFFLRVLKVIIQLRDAALQAMKKSKMTAAAIASNKAASMPTVQEEEVDEAKAASPESMEVEGGKEDKPSTPSASTEPSLDSLSDQLHLCSLWDTLSACLRDLADTPDHHAVLVLQATVEAFFLVHAAPTRPEDKKKIQQKETRQEQLAHIQEQVPSLGGSQTPEPVASPQPLPTDDDESTSKYISTTLADMASAAAATDLPMDTQKFLAFAETHRTVLNQILRQSTVHLADGPFSVLVDHTRVLDFDIKRRYSFECLKKC